MDNQDRIKDLERSLNSGHFANDSLGYFEAQLQLSELYLLQGNLETARNYATQARASIRLVGGMKESERQMYLQEIVGIREMTSAPSDMSGPQLLQEALRRKYTPIFQGEAGNARAIGAIRAIFSDDALGQVQD